MSVVFGAIAFTAKPARKTALLFGVAGAWSVLLVGVELLPATVLGADSVRNVGQAPPSLAFSWATHPLRLLELAHAGLIPDVVRPQVLGQLLGGGTAVFATTLYFGVVAFGALAAGLSGLPRPSRVALGLGAIAVLLALGGHLGLLGAVQSVLPMLGKFRYPERYLAFFWVAMLWIVPLGFDRAMAEGRRAFTLGVAVAGALNLSLAAPGAVTLLWAVRGNTPGDDVAGPVAAAWRASGLVALVVAIAAVGALALKSPRARWLAVGALLFADLWRANASHLPLVDETVFQPSPLAEAARGHRVASLAQRQWSSGVTLPGREEWAMGTIGRLRPTCAALSRVETLGSNLGATQRRHALAFGGHDARLEKLMGLFDGCSAVVDDVGPAPEGAARAEALGMRLEPRACWPRVFLARAVRAPLEVSVGALEQLRLDERRVPWEGPASLDSDEGTVSWKLTRPEELRVAVEVPRPTALIVTNDWVPGWSATIDGAEAALHPALVTALAVEVPSGAHEVVLTYRTPRLAAGAAMSLLGLSLLVTVLVARGRAARAAPSPSVP